MRLALCTHTPTLSSHAAIAEIFLQHGWTVDICNGLSLTELVPYYHLGILRSIHRYKGNQSRQSAVFLETIGVPFINSLISQQRAANKWTSHLLFAFHHIPQPDTWLLDKSSSEQKSIVVKPLDGSRGKNIILADDHQAALQWQYHLKQPCLGQEFISGNTIRVLATAEDPVRVYRKTGGDSWIRRSGFGKRDRYINEAAAELGCRMVAAVGGDYMGADILEDASGKLYALEVNSKPGFDYEDLEVLEKWVQLGYQKYRK